MVPGLAGEHLSDDTGGPPGGGFHPPRALKLWRSQAVAVVGIFTVYSLAPAFFCCAVRRKIVSGPPARHSCRPGLSSAGFSILSRKQARCCCICSHGTTFLPLCSLNVVCFSPARVQFVTIESQARIEAETRLWV